MPLSSLRVLVVDDSVVVRRMLSDLLLQDPTISLVDTAPNGALAVKKVSLRRPDVVILDVEMPEMDGLQTIKALRAIDPALPIIMFSALTEHAADVTISALLAGANDYVTKPSQLGNISRVMDYLRAQLLTKIRFVVSRRLAAASSPAAASGAATPDRSPSASSPSLTSLPPLITQRQPKLIVVAASTGGPGALIELLKPLPPSFPIPILIVQHMPPVFTRRMAERVTALTTLRCLEGIDGAPLSDAQIWIAPGGYHMTVTDGPTPSLRLNQDPPEHECRPAADPLFRAAAAAFGGRVVACVLTGMGRDGTAGCRAIHAAGGLIFAQDRASAVIWSMPEHVVQAGLAHSILPPADIGTALAALAPPAAPNTSPNAPR